MRCDDLICTSLQVSRAVQLSSLPKRLHNPWICSRFKVSHHPLLKCALENQCLFSSDRKKSPKEVVWGLIACSPSFLYTHLIHANIPVWSLWLFHSLSISMNSRRMVGSFFFCGPHSILRMCFQQHAQVFHFSLRQSRHEPKCWNIDQWG